MIKVTYSDNDIQEYKNLGIARMKIMENLHLSQGFIKPVWVTNILGATTDGISVEMDLEFKYGFNSILGGWVVVIYEIPRR